MNWSPTIHWKLGPSKLPLTWLSLMPPMTVDIVHVIVDNLEWLHNLIGDEVDQVVKVWHPVQPTELPEAVVARQLMVPSSLDVQGSQIHVDC